jgi:hypothetical protein
MQGVEIDCPACSKKFLIPQMQANEAEPPTETPPVPPSTQPKATLLQNLGKSARMGAKQAERKKLELIDAKAADMAIGQRAYDISFSPEKFRQIYQSIAELDRQVAVNKAAKSGSAQATLGDKVKHAAGRTKELAEAEVLLMKRKGILTELGKTIREEGRIPPELAAEIASATAILDRIKGIDKDIEGLSSQVTMLLRKPLVLAGAIAAILVALFSIGPMKAGCQRWNMQQEAKRAAKEVDLSTKRMAAEMSEMELSLKQEQLKAAQDARADEARQAYETKQREIDDQKEELRRETERRKEEQERQAKTEQDQLQKANEERVRAEQEKNQHQQEQAVRAAFCADKFAAPSLTPRAVIAPTLQRYNSTVELKGKDISKITALQQARNWLGLINLLLEKQYEEYPPAYELESALREILDYDYSILLKTSFVEGGNRQLYLIYFPLRYQVVEDSTSWERHPDGIGYIHRWNPNNGPVIIVAGDYDSVEKQINSFQQTARNQEDALRKKFELGELDEATHQQRLLTMRKSLYDAVFRWASSK